MMVSNWDVMLFVLYGLVVVISDIFDSSVAVIEFSISDILKICPVYPCRSHSSRSKFPLSFSWS